MTINVSSLPLVRCIVAPGFVFDYDSQSVADITAAIESVLGSNWLNYIGHGTITKDDTARSFTVTCTTTSPVTALDGQYVQIIGAPNTPNSGISVYDNVIYRQFPSDQFTANIQLTATGTADIERIGS